MVKYKLDLKNYKTNAKCASLKQLVFYISIICYNKKSNI
jgi:hypothetical protein